MLIILKRVHIHDKYKIIFRGSMEKVSFVLKVDKSVLFTDRLLFHVAFSHKAKSYKVKLLRDSFCNFSSHGIAILIVHAKQHLFVI